MGGRRTRLGDRRVVDIKAAIGGGHRGIPDGNTGRFASREQHDGE